MEPQEYQLPTITDLGTPTTIGQLNKLIADYPDDMSLEFRGGPRQVLREVKFADGSTCVVFQELPPERAPLTKEDIEEAIRKFNNEPSYFLVESTNLPGEIIWQVTLECLIRRVGYKQGPVNLIALLGLIGESGEIAGEFLKQFICLTEGPTVKHPVIDALYTEHIIATCCDDMKKAIRDRTMTTPLPEPDDKFDEEAFDREMADKLYYFIALAVCRGKSIEDYAHLAFDKVSKKEQIQIGHGTLITADEG